MPGRKISRYKSDGYPPARFSGHDMLYTVAANCSDPRTVFGHHGGEQCDPQPLHKEQLDTMSHRKQKEDS